jgi:hypothetical protein
VLPARAVVMVVVNSVEAAPRAAVNIAGLAAPAVCIAAACSAVVARAVPVLQGERKPAAAFELAAAQEFAVALELAFASGQYGPAEHRSVVVQCAYGMVQLRQSAALEFALASDWRAIAGRLDAQPGRLCRGRH